MDFQSNHFIFFLSFPEDPLNKHKNNVAKNVAFSSLKSLFFPSQDLKKYHYYYWFAFPALIIEQNATAKKPVKVSDKFSTEQVRAGFLFMSLAKRISAAEYAM